MVKCLTYVLQYFFTFDYAVFTKVSSYSFVAILQIIFPIFYYYSWHHFAIYEGFSTLKNNQLHNIIQFIALSHIDYKCSGAFKLRQAALSMPTCIFTNNDV